jgi:hypothetical protein
MAKASTRPACPTSFLKITHCASPIARAVVIAGKLKTAVLCGCFFCKKTLPPNKIVEWTDDDQTAICPVCGVDSVIGDGSGLQMTKASLTEMRIAWFF